MKIMLYRFSFFALLLASLSSCETEVDLNAPYESYTTIYGVLDLSADTQFIRINKSFLGPGSALDFAQVKDSSEYPIDAVEAYITTGNDTFPLHPIDIPNREPGVFYDEDIRVYITDDQLAVDNQGNVLNIESQYNDLVDNYKLVVNVNGKTLTANTEPTYLRQFNSIQSPNPSNNVDLNWVGANSEYAAQNMIMRSVSAGVRYEARIIFHYDDYLTNNEVISRSYEFEVGATELTLGTSNQPFDMTYSPAAIAEFISDNADCDNVAYRVLKPVEFVMMVAGEDLSRYIDINSPITGVVTERPEYSNIEGENAIGLFSSRYKVSVFKTLNNNTKEMWINESDLTNNLCFCDPESATFDCPPLSEPCDCN